MVSLAENPGSNRRGRHYYEVATQRPKADKRESVASKAAKPPILQGGKRALRPSNQLIADHLVKAARQRLAHFPEHAIQLVRQWSVKRSDFAFAHFYVDMCSRAGARMTPRRG